MRFQCPSCKEILDTGEASSGEEIICGKCRTHLCVPENPVSPGVLFGDFLLVEKIGTGGMGEVYRAHQVTLDREAAVKVLLPKFSSDEKFISEFIREARMAAVLSHQNIMHAYDVNIENGIYYFAMELLTGDNLKVILDRQGPFPPEAIIDIAQKMTSALRYAWREKQMLHRDIKPENMILEENNHLKLADFGLARCGVQSVEENYIYGTPQYLAPELITGESATIQSDIYGLGASLYHLLTGQYVYNAPTAEEIAELQITGTLVPVLQARPDTPLPLAVLLEGMLAKRPAQRMPDYDTLTQDILLVNNGMLPHFMTEPGAFQPIDLDAPEPFASVACGKVDAYASSEVRRLQMLEEEKQRHSARKRQILQRVLIILGILLLVAGVLTGTLLWRKSRLPKANSSVQPAPQVKKTTKPAQKPASPKAVSKKQKKPGAAIVPENEKAAVPAKKSPVKTGGPEVKKNTAPVPAAKKATTPSAKKTAAPATPKTPAKKAAPTTPAKGNPAPVKKPEPKPTAAQVKAKNAAEFQRIQSDLRKKLPMSLRANCRFNKVQSDLFGKHAGSQNNQVAAWAGNWGKILEQAEAFCHDLRSSGRKYSGMEMNIPKMKGTQTLVSIQNDTLTLKVSVIKKVSGVPKMDVQNLSLPLEALLPEALWSLAQEISKKKREKTAQWGCFCCLVSMGCEISRMEEHFAREEAPDPVLYDFLVAESHGMDHSVYIDSLAGKIRSLPENDYKRAALKRIAYYQRKKAGSTPKKDK